MTSSFKDIESAYKQTWRREPCSTVQNFYAALRKANTTFQVLFSNKDPADIPGNRTKSHLQAFPPQKHMDTVLGLGNAHASTCSALALETARKTVLSEDWERRRIMAGSWHGAAFVMEEDRISILDSSVQPCRPGSWRGRMSASRS